MCNVEGPPLKKQRPQPLHPTEPVPIYLDYNATTPLGKEAWEAMCRVQTVWGNPSSSHPYGLAAKFELEEARRKVQRALNAPVTESIIFTSGGTESNNLAILGGVGALRTKHPRRRYIVSTNVEHPAVEEVLKFVRGSLARQDVNTEGTPVEIIRVAVNPKTGQLDPETLRQTLQGVPGGPDSVALVSVMYANNELGSVNPVRELCAATKEICGASCLFHTDAAQSLGKVLVDVMDDNVDLLSVCGHKFNGPKGVGALYIKPGIEIRNVSFGAGHEHGIRPGTENVLLAAGMADALLFACTNLTTIAERMRETRDELCRVLKRELHLHDMDFSVNGDLSIALPNTLNCAVYKKRRNGATGLPVSYISAQRLIMSVGDRVCMSAGSACHSSADAEVNIEVSAPLKAVGVDLNRAIGTLRLSTGRSTTLEEVRRAGKIIARHAAQQFAD